MNFETILVIIALLGIFEIFRLWPKLWGYEPFWSYPWEERQ